MLENTLYIILAALLGSFAGSLSSSVLFYIFHLIPFIKRMDNRGELIKNHGLYRYVIKGVLVSALISLLVLIVSYNIFDFKVFRWTLGVFLWFSFIGLFEIFILKNSKSKDNVISNFKDKIDSKKVK